MVNIFDVECNPLLKQMSKRNTLPTESEVREYLDQFATPDASALSKFMPSVDQLINKEINRKKTKDDDRFYPEPDPGKWPVDVEDAWIATSFGYNLDNCPESRLQELEEEGKTNIISEVGIEHYPPEFTEQLEICRQGFYRQMNNKSSRGRHFHTVYDMKQTFESYHETQMRGFHEGLREKEFIKVRSEPELEQEILARRAQFPGWKVYTLLGDEMVDYLGNIHETYIWNGAHLIRTDQGYSGLAKYESAVFAECQVRASHKFYFHYHPVKVPRWWTLYYASMMHFAIEIDKRVDDNNKIKGKQTLTQMRFGNLE